MNDFIRQYHDVNILRRNLPSLGPEMEHLVNSDAAGAARQALEWRISHAKHFIEDWEWRLSILERLQPLSEHTWSWKEALIILRAAPSKLLNLFPTLNRWIQMQSNLHKVSEFAIGAKSNNADAPSKSEAKIPVKHSRDPESEIDDMGISGNISLPSSEFCTQGLHGFEPLQELPKLDTAEVNTTSFLSFDWENEGPYEKAVGRLIGEGKLMDALALSDRCLCSGASDQLLQLLIEHEEENNTIPGQSNGHGFCNIKSTSWQYCLRLKDKQLAARLGLKYLHGWELNAAIDVLTMCSCHLPQGDLVRDEVLHMREALQRSKFLKNSEVAALVYMVLIR